MEVLTYVLGAAGLIGGLLLGWILRHNLLRRHLSQSRKQLEEVRSLQMTAEHELSNLRQKLIQENDSREKLSSAVKEAQNVSLDTQEKLKALDDIQAKIEQIQEDNEVLQEQIAYLESEKMSLKKSNDAFNDKLKTSSSENSQLRAVIKDLQAEKERLQNIPRRPGTGIPRVRRVDPEEWKDIQKQQESQESEKDSTSRIKQTKSTDRFKSKEKSIQGETTGFQPKVKPEDISSPDDEQEAVPQGNLFPEVTPVQTPPPPEPIPEPIPEVLHDPEPLGPIQQEIPEPIIAHMPEPELEPVSVPPLSLSHEPDPVFESEPEPMFDTADDGLHNNIFDESDEFDEVMEGTDPGISIFEDEATDPGVTPEETASETPPPPPEPHPKPARHSSKRSKGWDLLSELNSENGVSSKEPSGKKRKRTRRKKKTPTVRTDITSSDIIDSFKKELGLPE